MYNVCTFQPLILHSDSISKFLQVRLNIICAALHPIIESDCPPSHMFLLCML